MFPSRQVHLGHMGLFGPQNFGAQVFLDTLHRQQTHMWTGSEHICVEPLLVSDVRLR